jgi:hypothetical protein
MAAPETDKSRQGLRPPLSPCRARGPQGFPRTTLPTPRQGSSPTFRDPVPASGLYHLLSVDLQGPVG